ncbi:hypothetical protein BGZ91_008104, partial [Linnemannia elongata]
DTRVVDYTDKSLTENTRCAYPIEYIPNALIPCIGKHPKNIVMLTCDAQGVLPPVSKLTSAQAMYHFISGYTSKMAGTEDGIPKAVTGVPAEVLNPATAWQGTPESFKDTVSKLAALFNKNFAKYADQATEDVIAAGPKL